MIYVIRKGKQSDVSETLDLVRELAVFEKAPKEVEVTINEMKKWGFGPEKIFDFYVAEKNNKLNIEDLKKILIDKKIDKEYIKSLDKIDDVKRLIYWYSKTTDAICNKLKNIDPAIQSRCVLIRFGQLKNDDIYKNIEKNENERIEINNKKEDKKINKNDYLSELNLAF